MKNIDAELDILRAENERLRAENGSLYARLAALEKEKSDLQRKVNQVLDCEKIQSSVHQRGDQVNRLVVSHQDDMRLDKADSLTLQILDALPIQIFLKDAEITKDQQGNIKGRKYRYLNKKTLDTLHWKFDDVRTKYDLDAMPDEQEWKRMEKLESKTIATKERHETTLKWTMPSEELGWLIIQVTQLAVVLCDDDSADSVGFCSIAHSIPFEKFKFIYDPYNAVFSHEFSNAFLKTRMFISDANTALNNRNYDAVHLALRCIEATLNQSDKISDAFFKGFKEIGLDEHDKALFMYENINKFAEKLIADIVFETKIEDSVYAFEIKYPKSMLAIFLELIRNSIKHSDMNFRKNTVPKITIRVKKIDDADGINGHLLQWTISNKAKNVRLENL